MKILLVLLATSLLAQTASQRGDLDLYYVVFLRPAPLVQPLTTAEAEKLQAAHKTNIHTMVDAGILVAAGSMDDHPSAVAQPNAIAGVFMLKAASPEQAWTLAGLDPTVVQRRNMIDVHSWRGPKGVGVAYQQWRKQHPDEDDKLDAYTLGIYVRGPRYTPDAAALHEQWVARLHKAGRLAAAGRIENDDADLVALTVFKASSIEQAKREAADDPSIKSGAYIAEFHKWSPADLMMPW
ncbi:MAG TPA: hypothetical protein VK419_06390 [Bryobacteraceae bacterium]|nr:hypothetical protein [Bryobacteraceae bacterium]